MAISVRLPSHTLKALLLGVALSLSTVACAPIEQANCSNLAFSPVNTNGLLSHLPPCPNKRIYSYNPDIFKEQAVWTTVAKEAEKEG